MLGISLYCFIQKNSAAEVYKNVVYPYGPMLYWVEHVGTRLWASKIIFYTMKTNKVPRWKEFNSGLFNHANIKKRQNKSDKYRTDSLCSKQSKQLT